MTSKKEKISKILYATINFTYKYYNWINRHSKDPLSSENEDAKRPFINRMELRKGISSAYDFAPDRHTISKWITFLMGKGFISPNPTSEYIIVDKGLRSESKAIPNNSTRYFVHLNEIREYLKTLNEQKQKVTTHPLSKQLSLSGFNELAIVPKENNGKDAPKNSNN